MEDDATRPEPADLTQDGEPLEQRLKRLEAEAAALREELANKPAHAAPIEPEPDPEVEAEPELAPATPAQIAEAEGIIRRARLARNRGQNVQADELLRQAADVAPNSPAVLEAIGDDHYDKGQLGKAREYYERAFRLDKSNVSVERKFGMTLVQTDPIATMMVTDLDEPMIGTKVPPLLSAILPGLGQIVSGEVGKGVALLIFYVGSLAWVLSIPNGVQGLLGFVSGKSGQGPGQVPFNATVLLPIFMGVVAWIISVSDATMKAKARRFTPVDRPRPPVDLPFE